MKLYHGDCLEIMKELPDESIDAVISDPPYGINYLSNMTKNHHRIANDSDSFEPTMEAFFIEVERLVKKGGVVVTCCGGGRFPSLPKITMMGMEHFDLYNTIIWSKGKTDGSYIGVGWTYRPSWEGVVVFSKGDHKFRRDKPVSNVFVCRPVQPFKNNHPTQKPVELMEFFIRNHTDEGGVVLDPFMGSGTTGVAALKNNREFIGMELDEGYFKMAQSRLSGWKGQTNLFANTSDLSVGDNSSTKQQAEEIIMGDVNV